MKSFQKESSTIISSLMRLLDISFVILSVYLAYDMVFKTYDLIEKYTLAYLFGVLVIIVILDLFGMYRAWRGSSKVKLYSH